MSNKLNTTDTESTKQNSNLSMTQGGNKISHQTDCNKLQLTATKIHPVKAGQHPFHNVEPRPLQLFVAKRRVKITLFTASHILTSKEDSLSLKRWRASHKRRQKRAFRSFWKRIRGRKGVNAFFGLMSITVIPTLCVLEFVCIVCDLPHELALKWTTLAFLVVNGIFTLVRVASTDVASTRPFWVSQVLKLIGILTSGSYFGLSEVIVLIARTGFKWFYEVLLASGLSIRPLIPGMRDASKETALIVRPTSALTRRTFMNQCLNGVLYPMRVTAENAYSSAELTKELVRLKSLTAQAVTKSFQNEDAHFGFLQATTGRKRLAMLHLYQTDPQSRKLMNAAFRVMNANPAMEFAAANTTKVDELLGTFFAVQGQRAKSIDAIPVAASGLVKYEGDLQTACMSPYEILKHNVKAGVGPLRSVIEMKATEYPAGTNVAALWKSLPIASFASEITIASPVPEAALAKLSCFVDAMHKGADADCSMNALEAIEMFAPDIAPANTHWRNSLASVRVGEMSYLMEVLFNHTLVTGAKLDITDDGDDMALDLVRREYIRAQVIMWFKGEAGLRNIVDDIRKAAIEWRVERVDRMEHFKHIHLPFHYELGNKLRVLELEKRMKPK
jgi:hypothetical protein